MVKRCRRLAGGQGRFKLFARPRDNSSDLLGPRASRPQISAKRENVFVNFFEKSAFDAFAGGTPAVPATHLTDPCQLTLLYPQATMPRFTPAFVQPASQIHILHLRARFTIHQARFTIE